MTFDEYLREFIDRAEPHTITASDAAITLLSLAVAGEPWAYSKVYDLARAQLVSEIKTRRAAASTITYTDRTGRKRRMNTAVSRPVVDPSSGEIAAYNLVLEWDMDATQLNAVLADLQRSSVEVRQRVDAVRALLAAMARHPKCETAREAWVADGRTTDEIDLSA